MSKQPYIPLYIGDYIRDTRILPLNVRGGWIEIILQSWDNGGVITGSIDDFARLMSCTKDEALLVIQTLKQKNIFAWTDLPTGEIQITCRKIKKMREISEKRKTAGFKGGNPNLLNQKDKQNPEYEYEIDNEIELDNRKAKFVSDVSIFRNKYTDQLLKAFCEYWMEHNPNGKKMRFEMQKVFDISRRLTTWKNNESKFSKHGTGKQSDIRVEPDWSKSADILMRKD